MLVGQDSVSVDIYRRLGANRVLNTYRSRETVVLESVNLSLPADQIYADVPSRV